MATRKRGALKGTKGLLSLEASIALTLFIFLMLFMYSFLVVFEARNQMAHVLLTTADSLALDAFANEVPEDKTVQEMLYGLYGKSTESNGTYTEASKWYEDKEKLKDVVKARFLAYFSGSDKAEAERILKQLNVKNGLAGLDFSNCCVKDGELYVEVRYTLEYEFQVFGSGGLKTSQSCCSKLWK